jgi:ATP-binding cassette subfamily F protein uup
MPPAPPLLSVRGIGKAFSARPLFSALDLDVHSGDRLGLIGPNGAGKSTLLAILAGKEEPDHGERVAVRGLHLVHVPQTDAFPAGAKAMGVVEEALVASGAAADEAAVTALAELDRAGFADPEAEAKNLSGGWRKRLALVAALARKPDLLLLDEPTNHLDLAGTLWLEAELERAQCTCVIVSHDRWFLERVATRVAEISPRHPGGCFSAVGGYSDFLAARSAALAAQAQHQEALENRLRRELEWLRKQPKARTVKSAARVKSAGALAAETAETSRRNSSGRPPGIDFAATARRANRLLGAVGVGKAYGGRTLFSGLDLELAPGERLGLLGGNGSGKTTLLRVLAGVLKPDSGQVNRTEGLRAVVFAQDRSRLDPGKTLRKTMCPDGDTVFYRGAPVHLAAWAKRFAFRMDQLDQAVGTLSGGEQARLVISLLMLEPADILMLDEPTNDLDIPTLEVLEDALIDFPGCAVLVTHDRYLLARVATRLLALDGNGNAAPFADYAQWQDHHERELAQAAAASERARTPVKSATGRVGKGVDQKERKELGRIEEAVASAEAAVASAHEAVADPAVAADAARLAAACTALAAAESEVERLYARWSELEKKAAAG